MWKKVKAISHLNTHTHTLSLRWILRILFEKNMGQHFIVSGQGVIFGEKEQQTQKAQIIINKFK